MIDLTPLDVRNKRGDFKKLMRGYDPLEVDVFLELVAERLEALVRENIQLRDRTTTLQEQVEAQAGREQAVQDALVTAQELRKDIREQSQREADHIIREAESEARRMIAEAEAEVRSRLHGVDRQLDESRDSLQKLERRRQRFLQEFRGLLQRELDVVQVEEDRVPLEERTVDLDLGHRHGASPVAVAGAPDGGADETDDAAAGGTVVDDDVSQPSEDARPEAGDPPSPVEDASSIAEEASSMMVGEGMVEVSREPESGAGAFGSAAGEADDEAPRAESPPVDVADLGPEGAGEAGVAEGTEADDGTDATRGEGGGDVPSSPTIGGAPSSLELELMASASTEPPSAEYPEVPDLETVLAEAGIDEVQPPTGEEISPPPASQKPLRGADRRPEDRLVFDKDKKGKQG